MQNLKITLIQADLVWENISANLAFFDQEIKALSEPTDLVILPEMFSTGFSMNAESLAQKMTESAVAWLRETAFEKNIDIAGSLMIKENDRFYNRLCWARPDGKLLTYDKKHLFCFAGEDKVFSPGRENITVELNGWKIRPFICYDLRFPCWTRNFMDEFDLAIFVANWPMRRSAHWKTLLKARAIENQCYVAGVNRVGIDGNNLEYSGDSSVIDPFGEIIFHKKDQSCCHIIELSFSLLSEYRKKFPVRLDADEIYFKEY